jgi:cation transport ATPase
MAAAELASPVRYRVAGMDCPACAAKIEGAARKVAGVEEVRVSIASQEMTLRLEGGTTPLPELDRTIADLGYRLTRTGSESNDTDTIAGLTHVTPAYEHALWIVVLLNAGYGIVEIVGGFVAGSQSLKIGNVAVVIAAVLVAWTRTPWPDLVVAVVVAGLFLQSAYSIVRDARDDLKAAERSLRKAATEVARMAIRGSPRC